MKAKTAVAVILAALSAQAAAGSIACTALLDAASGRMLVREGQCGQRVTPASTFKIAISMMGYDSGILQDEYTPKLPFQEGYLDWNPAWRTDTTPASWMKDSVVWYSQQVTTQLGAARLQGYVNRFGYGNRDVGGTPGREGLTMSWINSSLKISPDEQLAFLAKLVNRKLGLAPQAYLHTANLLKQPALANGWEVWGKTGSGAPLLADGRSDGAHAYGWFVGWASKGDRTIVFARLVQDRKRQGGNAGPRARDALLRELPARLDAL